jgi:ATP-dependent RNA helicase SUPV3L1/SUV3
MATPPDGATVVAGGVPLPGFRRIGAQQVRLDQVERIARAAHDSRGQNEGGGRKPFAPDPALATSIGITPDTLAKLMAKLGFRGVEGDVPRWIWIGRPRLVSPKKPVAPLRDNAFAVLAGLRTSRG